MFPSQNSLYEKIDFTRRSENRYILHPQGKRRCATCQEIFLLTDFPSKGRGRLNSNCKRCENKRLEQWRESKKKSPEAYCSYLIPHLRFRATDQEVPFNLNAENLLAQWKIQSGRCFYTNAMLDLSKRGNRGAPHRDFPSLDRKEPKEGYVPTNIVWTSYVVNRMKNDLSFPEFKTMCAKVYELHRP